MVDVWWNGGLGRGRSKDLGTEYGPSVDDLYVGVWESGDHFRLTVHEQLLSEVSSGVFEVEGRRNVLTRRQESDYEDRLSIRTRNKKL